MKYPVICVATVKKNLYLSLFKTATPTSTFPETFIPKIKISHLQFEEFCNPDQQLLFTM